MDQKIIYIGSIWEYLELDKNKSKNPDKYKKFEIIYDLDKIKKERNEVRNVSNNDEKRFSKEEKIVEEYIEEHPGVSYREAVLASLDRTEPEVKKVFTEEEKKQKEDLKTVEAYLEAHPKSTYKEAVRVALNKEELTLEEKLVEEYLEKNPGTSYREAVIEALSLLKKEE